MNGESKHRCIDRDSRFWCVERVGKVDTIIVPFRGYGTRGMIGLSYKFLLFAVCKVDKTWD